MKSDRIKKKKKKQGMNGKKEMAAKSREAEQRVDEGIGNSEIKRNEIVTAIRQQKTVSV